MSPWAIAYLLFRKAVTHLLDRPLVFQGTGCLPPPGADAMSQYLQMPMENARKTADLLNAAADRAPPAVRSDDAIMVTRLLKYLYF